MDAAELVIDAIDRVVDRGRLASFLRGLMVSSDEIAHRIARLHDIEGHGEGDPNEGGAPNAGGGNRPRPGPGGGRPRPGSRGGKSAIGPANAGKKEPESRLTANSASQPSRTGRQSSPPESFQASKSMQIWIEGMQKFIDAPDLEGRYGFGQRDASSLVRELLLASRRCGLKDQIKRDLKGTNYSLSTRRQSAPAAIICAEAINRFVETFGNNKIEYRNRPQSEGSDGTLRPVFEGKPVEFNARDLPDEPVDTLEEFRNDWVFAMYDMFEKNALHGEDGTLNVKQNVRLGEIVKELAERRTV